MGEREHGSRRYVVLFDLKNRHEIFDSLFILAVVIVHDSFEHLQRGGGHPALFGQSHRGLGPLLCSRPVH